MKYIWSFFLLTLPFIGISQDIIEPCKFGQPLIDALRTEFKPNSTLGYGPARDILYSEIDNVGLELYGVYTDFSVTLDPNADPSVSAFQNGAGINAEHVYPQSKGASNEPQRSDLHNIFPSKVNVNEARGSCPFNEVTDSDTDKWYYLDMIANNTPSTDINLYSEKDEEDCVFEPREEVKGDIARAVFYFYGMYQSAANAADPNFFQVQKDILYQWHVEDPVDEVEHQRDSLIALKQGNHNPFILDSTLVLRAYFMADASYPDGDPNCFSLSTNVKDLAVNDWVKISGNVIQESVTIFSEKNEGDILLVNAQGQVAMQAQLNEYVEISMENLSKGFYFLQVRAEGRVVVFKIFKI